MSITLQVSKRLRISKTTVDIKRVFEFLIKETGFIRFYRTATLNYTQMKLSDTTPKDKKEFNWKVVPLSNSSQDPLKELNKVITKDTRQKGHEREVLERIILQTEGADQKD